MQKRHRVQPGPVVCGVRAGLVLVVTGFLGSALALDAVRLPGVFGDNMVLQRGIPLPVWGRAEAGAQVTVALGEHSGTTVADGRGFWQLRLDALDASSQPRSLTVAAASNPVAIVFTNVVVGDVWICSGQSNMEWSLNRVLNGEAEVAAATYPLIRHFDLPRRKSAVPLDDTPGSWRECSPASIAGFSAVGYFFGRRLHRETGVPVGLIGSNWGGTAIEPWIPVEGYRRVDELQQIFAHLDATDSRSAAGQPVFAAYLDAMEAWIADARDHLRRAEHLPPPPVMPSPLSRFREPTGIYNGMVHPLAPFGIRGVLWYQGESNGNEGLSYYHKMKALIGGWRAVWDQGDFPFYFVQLANFRRPHSRPEGGDGWAHLREAQRKTLEVPHTGMAVIIDIGEADDIHPGNKQDVGFRLAQWALHQAYGMDHLVPSGPLFRAQVIETGRIRLHFDYTGSGLMVGEKQGLDPAGEVPDGGLRHFAVAGDDQVWHWADARIDGDTVLISSAAVPHPVAVRYAFAMNPEGANLYNREGLPASPFRTDSW